MIGILSAVIKRLAELQNEKRILNTHASTDYFLQSGDKISFFLNTESIGSRQQLKKPIASSLKSVGHAIHELNKVFETFTYNDIFKSIAQGIFKMQAPVVVQSTYSFHHPM